MEKREFLIPTIARGPLFPLKRILSRAIYGNLENHMIAAAAEGNTPAMLWWIRCGASLPASGDNALEAAALRGHKNTAGWLIVYGVDSSKLPIGPPSRSEYLRSIEG